MFSQRQIQIEAIYCALKNFFSRHSKHLTSVPEKTAHGIVQWMQFCFAKVSRISNYMLSLWSTQGTWCKSKHSSEQSFYLRKKESVKLNIIILWHLFIKWNTPEN